MREPANGEPVSRAAEVQAERVRAAFEQIPVATLATTANATLMVAVLAASGQDRGAYAWLALSLLVAAARLVVWRAYRRAAPAPARYRRWALGSACGAFAAGLLWSGGSVLLFPEGEIYQLFWAFLLGGMCAGAAALHYAHLPSALAFILPAGVPLAIRFALEGTERRAAAAAMIGVFLVVLVAMVRRSSRYFGEVLQLRFDLAQRTRELDASNALLRREIAEHRATDPLVLASTAGMLEDLGHAAAEARSGPEALGLLRGGMQVDLVVADYAMPGMTGLQLAEELRRQWPQLPILLATGYAELRGAAVDRLTRLSKPFGQAALAEGIEECLRAAALCGSGAPLPGEAGRAPSA